jgi:hypothetical protein
MSFETRLNPDLIRILEAGAGFTFDGSARQNPDLVRLAAAARLGGGQLCITGLGRRLNPDLVRIAEAGKGHVTFAE